MKKSSKYLLLLLVVMCFYRSIYNELINEDFLWSVIWMVSAIICAGLMGYLEDSGGKAK